MLARIGRARPDVARARVDREAAHVRLGAADGRLARASARLSADASAIGAYAELSKFGIVLLVLVSARRRLHAARAARARVPVGRRACLVLAGVMLLSCGASALNQVQERDRDGSDGPDRRAGRCPRVGSPMSQGWPSRSVGIAAGAARAVGSGSAAWRAFSA